MKKKKLVTILLCLMMATSVVACKKEEVEEETTTSVENQRVIIGTIAGENVYFDEAKVYLRVAQLRYEQLYKEDLGEELTDDLWQTKVGDTDDTLAKTVKDEVMSLMVQTKVILSHAGEYNIELSVEEEDEISRKADQFMKSTSKTFINASTASRAVMNQIYTENAIIDKVYQKIIDSVVLDEEESSLRQINIKYVDISLTDGQTPISVQDAKYIAESIKDNVLAGTQIENAAPLYGYSAKSANISTEGADNAVKQTAMALKTGEMGIAQNDSTVYLIYCENENDKEAIAPKLEELLKEKQQKTFIELYASWEKGVENTINEDIWNGIRLDYILTNQIQKELEASASGEVTMISDMFGFDSDEGIKTSESESSSASLELDANENNESQTSNENQENTDNVDTSDDAASDN